MTRFESKKRNSAKASPKNFSFRLLLICVLGMIAIKVITPMLNGEASERPGEARGDYDFQDECLADRIGEWKKTSFTPAALGNQLDEGQFWWSHQWHFATDKLQALTSVQQCRAFLGWHELTYCYEGSGWDLEERTIFSTADESWPCVIAKLKRDNGTFGIVVFSLFYKDGLFAIPPRSGNMPARRVAPANAWVNRLRNMNKHNSSAELMETIQCQTFCVTHTTWTDNDITPIVSLHIKTRQLIFESWIAATREDKHSGKPLNSE